MSSHISFKTQRATIESEEVLKEPIFDESLRKKCEAVDHIIASIKTALHAYSTGDEALISDFSGQPSVFLPLDQSGYEEALKMALRIRSDLVSTVRVPGV